MSDLIVLNRSRDFSHWFLIYRGIIGKSHRHIGVLIHVVPTSDHSISTHPMHSCPCAHCLASGQVAKLPLSLSGRLPSWASPFLRRLANASGRIEFIIFLIMDWSFASGCSPPRPSATQLPSATDSQCSVRWGLSPHCWCALSGARRCTIVCAGPWR